MSVTSGGLGSTAKVFDGFTSSPVGPHKLNFMSHSLTPIKPQPLPAPWKDNKVSSTALVNSTYRLEKRQQIQEIADRRLKLYHKTKQAGLGTIFLYATSIIIISIFIASVAQSKTSSVFDETNPTFIVTSISSDASSPYYFIQMISALLLVCNVVGIAKPRFVYLDESRKLKEGVKKVKRDSRKLSPSRSSLAISNLGKRKVTPSTATVFNQYQMTDHGDGRLTGYCEDGVPTLN